MGEYEEFVKTQRVRALDPLTSIDERVDFLGPKIIDSLERLSKIEESLGVEMPTKKTEQIPFAYTLAKAGLPGSGVTLMEYAPFSGYIKQCTLHWPDGADALVDIRVGHGTVQFCPDEGYLALNDATPTYPFSEFVSDHEEIWVELRNRDGGNEHSITVTVMLEGVAL